MTTWNDVINSGYFSQQEMNMLNSDTSLREGLQPDAIGVAMLLRIRITYKLNAAARKIGDDDPVGYMANLSIPLLAGLAVKDIFLGDPKSALAVMGAVTFSEFIYEESVQAATYPIYLLMQNKLYDQAEKQIDLAESIIGQLEAINKSYGVIAPFSYTSFRAYAEAAKHQVASYRTILAKARLAPPPKGTKPVTPVPVLPPVETAGPPSSVTSEAQLLPWYFKNLINAGRVFQFRGTFTATPYRVTVNVYPTTGPTQVFSQQDPNAWLPATVAQ